MSLMNWQNKSEQKQVEGNSGLSCFYSLPILHHFGNYSYFTNPKMIRNILRVTSRGIHHHWPRITEDFLMFRMLSNFRPLVNAEYNRKPFIDYVYTPPRLDSEKKKQSKKAFEKRHIFSKYHHVWYLYILNFQGVYCISYLLWISSKHTYNQLPYESLPISPQIPMTHRFEPETVNVRKWNEITQERWSCSSHVNIESP